jgi:hypothetical protein
MGTRGSFAAWLAPKPAWAGRAQTALGGSHDVR